VSCPAKPVDLLQNEGIRLFLGWETLWISRGLWRPRSHD